MQIGQKGKRVVDLCRWIDKNAYNENVDKEVLFDSLFRCVTLICIKNKLFSKWTDYEPFGLYASTRLYLRLTNKKQFEVDSDGNPKMTKIVSILNFIKKTLRPMIVDFQQSEYKEEFSADVQGEGFITTLKDGLLYKARSQYSQRIMSEYQQYFTGLCSTIQNILRKVPYKEEKLTLHRLYISCLLTLLNQITVKNLTKKEIKEHIEKNFHVEEFINSVYKDEQIDSIILYHLDEDMKNYVWTLVNEIKNEIKDDLKQIIGENQPTDSVMQAIISNQLQSGSEE